MPKMCQEGELNKSYPRSASDLINQMCNISRIKEEEAVGESEDKDRRVLPQPKMSIGTGEKCSLPAAQEHVRCVLEGELASFCRGSNGTSRHGISYSHSLTM